MKNIDRLDNKYADGTVTLRTLRNLDWQYNEQTNIYLIYEHISLLKKSTDEDI